MQDTNTPVKIPLVFASSAGAPYTNAIPTASQIGITNGAASFTDGFPPLAFVPIASGGAGPFGKDFNGLLKQTTGGVQWYQAGGPIFYDSVFSAAIGGYPKGSVLANATVLGAYWISIVDNNTSDPDTGGANWNSLALRISPATATIFYVNFTTGSDVTGNGLSGTPWKTLQYAWNTLFATLNGNNQTISIQQVAGIDTGGLLAKAPISGVSSLNLIINGGISATGTAISVNDSASISVSGTGTIIGTQYDVVATNGGIAFISGGTYGACANGRMYAQGGGRIGIEASYTSVGNTPFEWAADKTGTIAVLAAATVTLTGTPAYGTAFAFAETGGQIAADHTLTTFSGAATGKRFYADLGGGIFTNGGTAASYFPGSIAGTPAVGTLSTLAGWTDQV